MDSCPKGPSCLSQNSGIFFFFLTVKEVGVKSDNSRSPCASRGEVLISSSLWSFSIPKNLFLIGNSIRIPHYHCLFHSPVGKGTKAPLAGYFLLNGGNEYSLVSPLRLSEPNETSEHYVVYFVIELRALVSVFNTYTKFLCYLFGQS